VLRFDGDGDYLEVSDSDSVSIAGDITTLFVVKMDDFDTVPRGLGQDSEQPAGAQ
jgi:hypothetical protein